MLMQRFAAHYNVKPNGRTGFPLIFATLEWWLPSIFSVIHSLSLSPSQFAPCFQSVLLRLGTENVTCPGFLSSFHSFTVMFHAYCLAILRLILKFCFIFSPRNLNPFYRHRIKGQHNWVILGDLGVSLLSSVR